MRLWNNTDPRLIGVFDFIVVRKSTNAWEPLSVQEIDTFLANNPWPVNWYWSLLPRVQGTPDRSPLQCLMRDLGEHLKQGEYLPGVYTRKDFEDWEDIPEEFLEELDQPEPSVWVLGSCLRSAGVEPPDLSALDWSQRSYLDGLHHAQQYVNGYVSELAAVVDAEFVRRSIPITYGEFLLYTQSEET